MVVIEPDQPNRRFYCKTKLKKVTKKTVKNCLQDFEGRDLRRFYKSEEPVKEANRNVYYVVGKKFGKQIYSNYKQSNLVLFYNSSNKNLVSEFRDFAEKLGKIKKFNFNVFNMDANEHRQVLHVVPGTLLFFNPDNDNIAEVKPEKMDDTSILQFLKEKAPKKIYTAVMTALQAQAE